MADLSPLDSRLEEALQGGTLTLGEVLIQRRADGSLEMRHEADAALASESLEAHQGPLAARAIAWYDGSGEYRPLKGARSLRKGWRLELQTISEVRAALDEIYPAAIGMWHALEEGSIRVASLRETLERQTGMYRFAQNISDEGAETVVQERCEAQCLRHRLWTISESVDAAPEWPTGQLPFLCPEACNMLVADARKVSKAEASQKG